MPIYEYRCLDCRHEYEKREGFDAPALQECPKCDGTARRVIQAAPIVFKGSGFYKTDSRKAESPSSAPEAEAEASGSAATPKDAASTDTKSSKDSKDTSAEPATTS